MYHNPPANPPAPQHFSELRNVEVDNLEMNTMPSQSEESTMIRTRSLDMNAIVNCRLVNPSG